MTATEPTNNSPVSQELEASAKVLTLPVGVFAFTVQGGVSAISSEEVAVPALQLGVAPMKSRGTVEFLAGADTLDRWLTNPEAFIPGQKMGFSVPDPQDRVDVIAFLASPAAR